VTSSTGGRPQSCRALGSIKPGSCRLQVHCRVVDMHQQLKGSLLNARSMQCSLPHAIQTGALQVGAKPLH
jgi:hypothetical protein